MTDTATTTTPPMAALPIARRKGKRHPVVVTAFTGSTKYEVVRRALGCAGISCVDEEEDDEVTQDRNCILKWMDTGVVMETVMNLDPWQCVNHFPGMHEICRKDNLTRNLNKMRKSFKKDYNFYPKSWWLPQDYMAFAQYAKARAKSRLTMFIAKPDSSSQGRGIFLLKNPADPKVREVVNATTNDMIVQKYLSRPLLIDGYKFDFRIYVLVSSCNPLRAFIYKEGLARFATCPYEAPTSDNTDNAFIHLTNYAINKRNAKFDANVEKGSKRTLTSVIDQLKANGHPVDRVWSQMKDAIVKTLIVVQPFLSRVYESCTTRPGSKDGNGAAAEDKSQCFEVLGFDIILDNKLKPWVLEVNHSPSLTCDADVDRDVKLALLSDSLRLLGLDQADEDSSTSAVAYRKRVLLAGRRDSHKRLVRMNNATAKVSRTVATSASPSSSSLALKAWEDHRIGSFERIFPIYDDPTLSDTYEKLLSASKATMALDQKETNAMRARKAFIQEKEAVKQKAENKFAAWKKAVSAGKYKVPTVSACTPEVRLEAPNEASHSVESQAACSSEETKRLPKIHGATSITKSTLVPKLMDWDYVDAFTPPTTKNKTVTNASRRRSSPPTTSTTDLRLSSSNAYSYRDITYDIDQMRI